MFAVNPRGQHGEFLLAETGQEDKLSISKLTGHYILLKRTFSSAHAV
jgi:hypothetical protein